MSDAAARKLRVGVLVNPIAGLGGRPGLKGSDDRERLGQLVATTPWDEDAPAFARGTAAVRRLDGRRVVLATAAGAMGEDVVKRATMYGGPVFEIVRNPGGRHAFGETTAADTIACARRLREAGVALVLFVGGDGTALDVVRAVGPDFPVLGVPAGVKMFSPVFAETPEVAAQIVNGLEAGFRRDAVDVVDLDEASYRTGAWLVRGQAVAAVPQSEGVQAGKGALLGTGPDAAADLATWFREHERPGVAYVLGAGSTMGAIKAALGGGTPLGVDVWRDASWAAVDAGEEALLETLGEEGAAEILVSPTGVQGAVLGRGTAQISPAVVDRVGVENVVVLATPEKLLGLRQLFVDTGDPELDRRFPDYVRVRTDPLTEKVFPLRRGVTVAR